MMHFNWTPMWLIFCAAVVLVDLSIIYLLCHDSDESKSDREE